MAALRGALAAAVTPLRNEGREPDPDAWAGYVEFLAAARLDGVLALGTTGEGILLSVRERERVVEDVVAASAGRLAVAAHCGAQTTGDTVALCAHAAEAGVDAVAVIGPPYYKLDAAAQLAHLRASAHACAPTPFYVYEFAATAGYALDLEGLARLKAAEPNVTGLKVSDTPWEAFARYLLDGWDVFAGPEALIAEAMAHGACGAVSGLAAVFPAEVAAVVREPTAAGSARLAELRAFVERFPRHAALKHLLGRRGVPVGPGVRAPLRPLAPAERHAVDAWLDALP
jgi:dihydrodipicolinate synthase/N-acetylneuraminate lyase